MDIISIIILVGLGYYIGKFHTYWKMARLIKEVAEEQGIDVQAELEKIVNGDEDTEERVVHKLQVEIHGEQLYLFDHETDEFICQGSSVQELCELALKYKKVLYAAVKYNDKVFAFKDGNSTEVTA